MKDREKKKDVRRVDMDRVSVRNRKKEGKSGGKKGEESRWVKREESKEEEGRGQEGQTGRKQEGRKKKEGITQTKGQTDRQTDMGTKKERREWRGWRKRRKGMRPSWCLGSKRGKNQTDPSTGLPFCSFFSSSSPLLTWGCYRDVGQTGSSCEKRDERGEEKRKCKERTMSETHILRKGNKCRCMSSKQQPSGLFPYWQSIGSPDTTTRSMQYKESVMEEREREKDGRIIHSCVHFMGEEGFSVQLPFFSLLIYLQINHFRRFETQKPLSFSRNTGTTDKKHCTTGMRQQMRRQKKSKQLLSLLLLKRHVFAQTNKKVHNTIINWRKQQEKTSQSHLLRVYILCIMF